MSSHEAFRVFIAVTSVLFPLVATMANVEHLNCLPLPDDPNNCFAVLNNTKVAWMAVFHGSTGSGTAEYFPNGTLITYSPDGIVVNKGVYAVRSVPSDQRLRC